MGPQRFTAGITRRDFLVFSGLLAAGTFLPCQETYAVPDDLDQIYSKIISQIHKTPDPDMGLEDDVWATPSQTLMIYSCLDKLNRVQRLTGFGKFNYICMKKTLLLAWQRRKTGRFKGSEPETTIPFTTKEKDFMRSFFGLDAANYGFYGKRVVCDMEYSIRPDELQYMGGHYIRKGPAMDRFRKIKDQVERHPALVNLISDPVKNSLDMVITSGIRNIPKQMRLFFNKAVKLQGIPPQKYFYTIDYEKAEKQRVSINRIKDEFDALKKDISILQKNHVPYNLLKDTGIEFTFHRKPYLLNLSAASRSLAPPGYSWHAMNDFDIGVRSEKYRIYNFRKEFVLTPLFKTLFKLNLIGLDDIRYGQGNRLGVRFEPWHIKVNFFRKGKVRKEINYESLYVPGQES